MNFNLVEMYNGLLRLYDWRIYAKNRKEKVKLKT